MVYRAHDLYTVAMIGGMVAREAGRRVETCPHSQDSLSGKAWRLGFLYDVRQFHKPKTRETVSRETSAKRVGGPKGVEGDRLAWTAADLVLLDRMLVAEGFPLKLAAAILGRSYRAIRIAACRRRKQAKGKN